MADSPSIENTLDRIDVIKAAPAYYLAAAVVAIEEQGDNLGEDEVRAFFVEHGGGRARLYQNRLWLKTMRVLTESGAIVVETDPFGPALISRGPGFKKFAERLGEDKDSPFSRSSRVNRRVAWIRAALNKLHSTIQNLQLSDEDFDVEIDEWAPIPLEHSDPALIKAKAALDKTVEAVEGSNGYAAQHPNERDYVLTNLKLLSERLKTAAVTSLAFIRRHGLVILQSLVNRFREVTIGQLASAASQALLRWLGLA